MTTIEFIFIVICALIALIGLYIFIRSMKHRQVDANKPVVEYDKNGIPIIPRHERNIVDPLDFDDTVAGETTITPDRNYLHAVVDNDDDEFDDDEEIPDMIGEEEEYTEAQIDVNAPTPQQPSQNQNMANHTTQSAAHIQSNDAFSSLVSATDNLMPVIDTVDEPEFTDNSPVLDKHLLAAADQDQNSPLNNAKDNINITLYPQQYRDLPPVTIRGEQLLSLIDKYGLKYGAMNMFHRYENKDGTGILWFSMMGITEEGVAPFDLNTMPHTGYDGVVLFLSLPHPKALQGFDSMMGIASMMSRELNAAILDENNEPLYPEDKARLRHHVQNYQS